MVRLTALHRGTTSPRPHPITDPPRSTGGTMASSVAVSLCALAAASFPKPRPAPSSLFLVLLAPALPRRLLRLRSARLLLLAASDSTFESSIGVDYTKPAKSEQGGEAFALEEEDDGVEASATVEGVAAAGAGCPTPAPPTR